MDSKTMVIASNVQFKIISISDCPDLSQSREVVQDLDDSSFYAEPMFSSLPFETEFKIQSIESVRHDAKVFLIVGGNHSVA